MNATLPMELLMNGSVIKAVNVFNKEQLGILWPAWPFIGIIFSIYITTKSDAVTAFSCLFGMIIMGASDVALSVAIHPIVYGIAVLTTAMMMYKAFWHGE